MAQRNDGDYWTLLAEDMMPMNNVSRGELCQSVKENGAEILQQIITTW